MSIRPVRDDPSFEGVAFGLRAGSGRYADGVPGVEDLRRPLRAMAVAALPLEEIWQRSDALLRRAVLCDVSA